MLDLPVLAEGFTQEVAGIGLAIAGQGGGVYIHGGYKLYIKTIKYQALLPTKTLSVAVNPYLFSIKSIG